MKGLDILIEIRDNRKKYFQNYLFYAKKIKKKAQALLKDKKLKIFLFGSILEIPHPLFYRRRI